MLPITDQDTRQTCITWTSNLIKISLISCYIRRLAVLRAPFTLWSNFNSCDFLKVPVASSAQIATVLSCHNPPKETIPLWHVQTKAHTMRYDKLAVTAERYLGCGRDGGARETEARRPRNIAHPIAMAVSVVFKGLVFVPLLLLLVEAVSTYRVPSAAVQRPQQGETYVQIANRLSQPPETNRFTGGRFC